VLTLKWARIDRQTETIRLEPGEAKNRQGRTFPYGLLPELRDVMESQWKEHERLLGDGRICPYVFHRNGCMTLILPGVGIEPTRPEGHGILSPERLPVPPPRPPSLYVAAEV
jgi:hypothetical protein